MYTEDNEKVTEELNALMNDFQYTIAGTNPEAKKIEKNIVMEFDALTQKLQQPDWAEDEVIHVTRALRRCIIEIGSMR